ncbi:fibrinogen-like protein A [Branchiostoma floridae x Branchiostoma belcheri]
MLHNLSLPGADRSVSRYRSVRLAHGMATTTRCLQFLVVTLMILCNDKTVAGDVIGGRGGRGSTDCPAVKNGTWTIHAPAGFPTARHLPPLRATWKHLEQHLQTAEGMLEQVKRHLAMGSPDMWIDCSAIFHWSNETARSGVYSIRLAGANRTVPVYCRMEGGQGWTVLMRRQDGSVDFYRTWEEYKVGFGNLSTEFWLGNDNIHLLTNQARYGLRVDLETFDGESSYAQYRSFSVLDEASKYKLSLGRGFSGTARNALRFSNNMTFATWDNDAATATAFRFRSAGWLSNSYFPNLNGVYYTPQTVPTKTKWPLDTIRWYLRLDDEGNIYPLLKFVELRVAPEVT